MKCFPTAIGYCFSVDVGNFSRNIFTRYRAGVTYEDSHTIIFLFLFYY